MVVWVPDCYVLRTHILALFHDLPTAGHFGKKKTLAAIRQRWDWPGLATDVDEYVRSCATCQMSKPYKASSHGECLPIVATEPWHTISVDFLSGFPEAQQTKYTDCLVTIDKFTKWVVAVPCRKNPTAAETARLLMTHVFQTFGLPTVIISDRGSQFTAKTWDEVTKGLGIESRLATPRHAQTNGQVERANSVIKRRLITAVTTTGGCWSELLPCATMAINAATQEATGVSPFEANFFREPRFPQHLIGKLGGPRQASSAQRQEILDRIQNNLQQAAETMRQRTVNAKGPHLFVEGERVWLRAHAFAGQDGAPKLHCAYYGPYVITKRVNDNAYKLQGLPEGVHPTQNVSEQRLYVESPVRFRLRPTPPFPQPIFINGREEWEVDSIIGYC